MLAKALTPPESLADFEQVRQRIMRLYSQLLFGAIVKPFLPKFLSKQELAAILKRVGNYMSAHSRSAMQAHNDARASLTCVLEDCARHDTFYVTQFFRPFFNQLKRQVTTHFEASPANRPGRLVLQDVRKRYPFVNVDADIRLAFVVENKGPGPAFDVELSIKPADCFSLPSPSQFLDHVESGQFFGPVEFPARVCKPPEDSVFAQYKLTWKNGDGTDGDMDALIELPTQPADIPWESLDAQPYSLEPVSEPDDLIGRAEQTARLVSKLTAPSVGSFFVYGQRRVGKTSVVVTLADLPKMAGVTLLTLEAGLFVVPDATQTIRNLGNEICTRLIYGNPKLQGLSVPEFRGTLAPLDHFLNAARQRDPDLRLVVVLDEFDELPTQLYRRGDMSRSFFVTLRSLSAKASLGFILVGGERMAEILSTHGGRLNKFSLLRLDYLDRESQWSDFVDLVRRPLNKWNKWATISEEAVAKLYDNTAGNPYFTKVVCAELVEDMKRRKDADVTRVEMDQAIGMAVEAVGINSFQHFWDDGVIAPTDEKVAEERAARRRVLLALGEVLRSKQSSTLDNVTERVSRFGMGESDVERILAEFEKRKVLVKIESQYECKVRLFQRWLVDEGVGELSLTLVEEEALREGKEREEGMRVKAREISELVDNWGSYRGKSITDNNLRAWLDQFATVEEQRSMFDLLMELRFYSGAVIREKLRDRHRSVVAELAARGVVRKGRERRQRRETYNIVISFFGSHGKRGPTYAKHYADENQVYSNRIVRPDHLNAKIEEFSDVKGIVFVDDFIGTGRTAQRELKEILEEITDSLEKAEICVFVVFISGFKRAAERLEKNLRSVASDLRVTVAEPLDESDKCFSDMSAVIQDEARRARAKEIAGQYGKDLVKRSPLGYGNCQALVVFENTCPNNSLPILWSEGTKGRWRPLFPRP